MKMENEVGINTMRTVMDGQNSLTMKPQKASNTVTLQMAQTDFGERKEEFVEMGGAPKRRVKFSDVDRDEQPEEEMVQSFGIDFEILELFTFFEAQIERFLIDDLTQSRKKKNHKKEIKIGDRKVEWFLEMLKKLKMVHFEEIYRDFKWKFFVGECLDF